jgi:putative resolvase
LNKIKKGEVEKVVIEYPDRLARFGFKYLMFFMESFGVELIVLNGKENEEDVNKELAEDLIAIVTSFAAKIYGQRSKKHDSDTG